MVQPQKQPRFQIKGIQPVEVPNNEPRQLVTTDVPFHQIPMVHKKRRESQIPSIGRFFTPKHSSQQQ